MNVCWVGHRYLRTERGQTVTGNISGEWSVENQIKSKRGEAAENSANRLVSSRPTRLDIAAPDQLSI